MAGIETLKEAAKAVISFGNKLEDALADGKLTFIEGITIAIGTAPDAFSLIQDAQELKAEFLDLDDAEMDALSEYVAVELDLDADKIELIVEKGFEFLISLYALVMAIRDAREEE
jgi:hypothetical protein